VLAVSLTERGSWTLRLRDGIEVVVGRSDPQERMRRFAHLLPQIAAARQDAVLLRADLRYTNGFSLTWQAIPVVAPPAGVPMQRVPAPTDAAKQAHT
jgi:cell division protein FtsQ